MSLKPERKNFEVWRGATFRVPLTLWQDAAMTNPYNLAGYSGEMLIKDKLGGTVIGTVEVSFLANVITLLADDETTATWAWQTGVYELKLTQPGGDVDVLFYGNFTVKDHA
jgi:hypothetical protein